MAANMKIKSVIFSFILFFQALTGFFWNASAILLLFPSLYPYSLNDRSATVDTFTGISMILIRMLITVITVVLLHKHLKTRFSNITGISETSRKALKCWTTWLITGLIMVAIAISLFYTLKVIMSDPFGLAEKYRHTGGKPAPYFIRFYISRLRPFFLRIITLKSPGLLINIIRWSFLYTGPVLIFFSILRLRYWKKLPENKTAVNKRKSVLRDCGIILAAYVALEILMLFITPYKSIEYTFAGHYQHTLKQNGCFFTYTRTDGPLSQNTVTVPMPGTAYGFVSFYIKGFQTGKSQTWGLSKVSVDGETYHISLEQRYGDDFKGLNHDNMYDYPLSDIGSVINDFRRKDYK